MNKRRWWLLIPLAILLIPLLVWGGGAALDAWTLRPVTGVLRSNLPDTQIESGGYRLSWDADPGEIRLSPAGNSGQVLMINDPGRPFIAAALGRETVEEQRAHYEISDARAIVCADQSLDAIEVDGETLLMRGELGCSDGTRSGYEMRLMPAQDGVDFVISFEDEALNRTYLTLGSRPEEAFFGFGEQFTYVNMKGRRVPVFVMEQGIGRGAQPITAGADLTAGAGGDAFTSYAPVPHYLTSFNRSLYLENSEYSVFDLRQPDRVQIEVFSGEMRGAFLDGESPTELIAAYTARTGRMRPLPAWITSGAIVGMQGGTERVREVYAQLQALDMPIAAFWLQDWVGQRSTSFGKQLWWNWEVDSERYPGWDQLVADFEAEGIRVMVYTSPYLADVSEKPGVRRHLFEEARDLGYLVQNAAGEPYLVQNTDFSAGLIDLTNPEAVDWYQRLIRDQVIGSGASGFMADFAEGLPYDAVLFEGDPAELHNRYPELWAETVRGAIEGSENPEEIVAFHRSGFTRSPGSATMFWLGDQLVSWDEYDGIKTAVMGLLSSGFSGFAYNHSDIGGYTTITNPIGDYHRSEALLLRWMELNAFTLIYRTHEGNQPDNNVQFYSNERTLAHFARMAQVYAAWGFYRDELVQEAAETGLPVVRHPFIHYPDDPAVYGIRYQQFMLGSDFMIAPVLDPDTDRVDIYLPAGEWVNLWTGESVVGGGSITVAAPPGQPAVFYPVGSDAGEQFRANLESAGLLP